MKKTPKIVAAALLGLGFATAGAGAASAAVACNREGVCWHTHHRYAYRPEYGVVVHRNDWRWGPHQHYVWREHGGRGYWSHGAWVRF